MKRTGAVWLVVGVVAVAALLMYFVVLPQMRDGKTVEQITQKAEDAVNDVKQAVNDAGKQVQDVADGVDGAKAALLAKMGRIGVDAGKAADELGAVLDKAAPTAEELAAAKAKLKAALQEAADFKLPADADSALAATAAKISEGAKAAIASIDTLPADPAAAKSAFADLKAKLLATLPGGEAPAPADATKSAPQQDGAVTTDTKTETKTAEGTTEADKTVDPAKAAIPAFDILRVEKDGSTVIAGRAAPGAKIEIVDGDKVIASTTADNAGDFAAVLDNPLAAGDHSIVIRATTKDGKASTSEEVATVSVPKDASGELLAMVTRPGEASKIITMPEAKEAEVASAKAVTPDTSKQSTEADASTTADDQAATEQTAAEKAKAEQQAKVEAPAKTDEATADQSAAAEVKTPELPSTAADIASTPPVVTADQTNAETKQQTPTADQAAADAAKSTDTAKSATAEPAGAPEVLVSAVELEGDRIFIAGNTKAGATVRVYADDQVVAEAKADGSGRFVADGTIKLAVGNHTIRADVLSADGSKVVFRASVPFFRPEGDLAAVASADTATNAPAIEPLANGTFDKARDEAGKALALLKGLYAGGKTPTAEELAAARSSAEIALKSLADVHVGADVDPAVADMAGKAIADAGKALDKLKAVPADVGAFKSALGDVETIVGSVVTTPTETASADTKSEINAKPADTKTAATQKADGGVDKAGEDVSASDVQVTAKVDRLAPADNVSANAQKAETAAATDTSQPKDGASAVVANGSVDGQTASADQPKVIEQAPLKQSEGSVIIRRGDTLWQISRRVYGKGVRYTTIYVANKAQIADPDEIKPGQIFTMPGKWLENSEELHKEHLLHDHRKN